MGINIEYKSNTFVINTKEDGTFENEDDIVCAVMESMTPFLKQYIHNLICDFDIWYDFTDNPESEKKVDIITEYITYNNGHFVDPKVHGGPIILSIRESEEE